MLGLVVSVLVLDTLTTQNDDEDIHRMMEEYGAMKRWAMKSME
jgi:hypothetical protein